MISCSKAREMIDNYIDGDISEADMTAFEDHISTCDDCRELYEFTIQMTSALKRSIQQPPADFTARVMERVRLEAATPVRQSKILPFFRNWKAYGSAAAAVLLLAVIGKTAVYDRYLDVLQPPSETAYVTDAPGIPDVPEAQPEQAVEPHTENKKTSQTKAADGAAHVPDNAAKSQPEETQPSGLPPNYGAYIGKPSMGSGEPTQLAGAEQPAADIPMEAEDVQIQGHAADDMQQPMLKSSVPQGVPELAADVTVAESRAAKTEDTDAAALDEGLQPFCAPAAIPETADNQVQSTAGGASVSSGGGGSAKMASAPIATPKVCHVTIRKSGEGNLLAIQRRLSAVIDGEINSSGDQLTVTVDPADFASTLAEIEATGFVEKTQTTDSADGKTIFYIQ